MQGFSLTQLLIVIAVVAIIASQSLNSFSSLMKTLELKGLIQSVYFQLQSARSHTVATQQPIVVDITSGPQWCIGLTDLADCDCQTIGSCTLDDVEKVISYKDFRNAQLSASSFANNNQTRFLPPRGLSQGYAGTFTLSNGQEDYKVIVSNTGRVRVCTLTLPVHPYKQC